MREIREGTKAKFEELRLKARNVIKNKEQLSGGGIPSSLGG